MLCSKGNHNQKKKKGQPTEWKKMFANDETDKGSISKMYTQLKSQQQQNDQSKTRSRPK